MDTLLEDGHEVSRVAGVSAAGRGALGSLWLAVLLRGLAVLLLRSPSGLLGLSVLSLRLSGLTGLSRLSVLSLRLSGLSGLTILSLGLSGLLLRLPVLSLGLSGLSLRLTILSLRLTRLTILSLRLPGLTVLPLLSLLTILLTGRRSGRSSRSSKRTRGPTGRWIAWLCTGGGAGIRAALGGGLLWVSRGRRRERLALALLGRVGLLLGVLLGLAGALGRLSCCEFGSETHGVRGIAGG